MECLSNESLKALGIVRDACRALERLHIPDVYGL